MSAKMDKTPESYTLMTYAGAIGFAVWGGVCGYFQRRGVNGFTLVSFIVNLLTSGFSGVLALFICEANNLDPLYTASVIGMSGYMGVSVLEFMKMIFSKVP